KGWGKTVDAGWSRWDLEIYCHPWTVVQLSTAQEEHGGDKYLIRTQYRLRASGYLRALVGLSLLTVGGALIIWPAAAAAAILCPLCVGLWGRGITRASQAVAVVDLMAMDLGMVRLEGKE